MNRSRLKWYWSFVAIVTSVGGCGCYLALKHGLTMTALFILAGSVFGILMMTHTYRNG